MSALPHVEVVVFEPDGLPRDREPNLSTDVPLQIAREQNWIAAVESSETATDGAQ